MKPLGFAGGRYMYKSLDHPASQATTLKSSTPQTHPGACSSAPASLFQSLFIYKCEFQSLDVISFVSVGSSVEYISTSGGVSPSSALEHFRKAF